MSATNTGIGYASESTSINTDNSVSQTLANQGQYGGDKYGADLSLAQSSGNTFNLADPTQSIIAGNIATLSLSGAFQGLQRITDTSNLAVARALDLARDVQGGQGEQVTRVVKYTLIILGILGGLWLLGASIFKRKRKGK